MDKLDLIYDTVCRLEEKTDKRLDKVECEISALNIFKNKAMGIILSLSIIGTFFVDFLKVVIQKLF